MDYVMQIADTTDFHLQLCRLDCFVDKEHLSKRGDATFVTGVQNYLFGMKYEVLKETLTTKGTTRVLSEK